MLNLIMSLPRSIVISRLLPILFIYLFFLSLGSFKPTLAVGEIPLEGAVYSVHRSDGSQKTYLDIVIGTEFKGNLPDDIDSISVAGPSGALDISKVDFNYNPQWREFWVALPGLPEIGIYSFQVKSGASLGSDTDIQVVNRVIPLLDVYPPSNESNLCSSPTFTWPLISEDYPLYYLFEINKGSQNLFRTAYLQDMSKVRISGNILEPGIEYLWRVRAADAPSWSTINNRSQSRWIRLISRSKLDSCSYVYDSPKLSGDGLKVSTLQNEGFDEERIKILITKILNEEILNIHSLLIVKNDRLVLEEYFAGYSQNALHSIASVTKSITSILIGIALDKQKILSVDSSIYDLLPSYRDRDWDTSHRAIRLEHVLTMTAGLDWNDWIFPDGDIRDSSTAMSKSNDWINFTLNRDTIEPPGKKFVYNNGLSLVLGEIIKDATSHHADKFAEQYLFTPLNIKQYRWRKGKNNIVQTAGGLALRPRDMAKIGLLMLNDGNWKEQQIVSSNWVRESTRMHLREHILFGAGYGYQWWRGEIFSGEKKVDLFYAAGKGGQYIFVCPELDLVVVMTSTLRDNPMGEFRPQLIMTNYVVPAVLHEIPHSSIITLDPADKEKYVGDYYSSTYGMQVKITNYSGKLIHINADGQKGELKFISENQCIADSDEFGKIIANFFMDESGAVTHFMLQVGLGFWQFDKVK